MNLNAKWGKSQTARKPRAQQSGVKCTVFSTGGGRHSKWQVDWLAEVRGSSASSHSNHASRRTEGAGRIQKNDGEAWPLM